MARYQPSLINIGEIKMATMRQGTFRFGDPRGGKRAGAGRPARGPRASERHGPRPPLRREHPVHVTLRTVAGVGRLRRRDVYRAMRRALVTALRRDDFRVVHLSIQGNHIHLLVEAANATALARGMQGLQISAAKHINRAIAHRTGARRRGQVFADRYHPRVITSPRQARHALAYVLNNWRRHGADRGLRTHRLDPYATGAHWDGWADGVVLAQLRVDVEILPVAFPTTWLLTTGWKRHRKVSPWERPGTG
ncbi:MAG: transposase [Kofleriaceae bacterium]|nr:transposase [Kofleriaceae bacterium]